MLFFLTFMNESKMSCCKNTIVLVKDKQLTLLINNIIISIYFSCHWKTEKASLFTDKSKHFHGPFSVCKCIFISKYKWKIFLNDYDMLNGQYYECPSAPWIILYYYISKELNNYYLFAFSEYCILLFSQVWCW